MHELATFLHLTGAILWLGGMAFVLWALRPVAMRELPVPQRVPLLAAVLKRFFVVVWISIALLAASGVQLLATIGLHSAPRGVHVMLAIGLLMIVIFSYLYFVPYQRLQRMAAAQAWPESGRQLARIHPLVLTNFVLGWAAIAAVLMVH